MESGTVPYLTVSEAATRLRCEPSAVRKWIRDGRLPAVRTPGGRILVAEPDLVLVLEPARRQHEGGRP